MSNSVASFLGLLLLLPLTAWSADGEKVADEAQLKSVVQASYEAARLGKWDDYAKGMDPRDLAQFQGELKPILQAAPINPTAPGNGLLDLFDGGKDLKTVTAWEPQEFFARFMRGTTTNTPLWQGYAGMKYKIIGVISENADQAHAVVRVEKTMGPLKVTRLEVVSLRRVAAAEWKVSLPEEIKGIAQTLRVSMFGPAAVVEETTTREEVQPE